MRIVEICISLFLMLLGAVNLGMLESRIAFSNSESIREEVDSKMGDFKDFSLKFLGKTSILVLLLIWSLSIYLNVLSEPIVLFCLSFFTVVSLSSFFILYRDRIVEWWMEGYAYLEEENGSLESSKNIMVNQPSTRSERIKNLPKEVLKYTKGWELTPEEALEKAYEILEEITKGIEPSLEQENVNEKPRVLTSKTPSRRELEALKKALGITKGSIQYKKRGDGIYLVTYNPSKKGYDWNHLGRWSDLKKLIYPKSVIA